MYYDNTNIIIVPTILNQGQPFVLPSPRVYMRLCSAQPHVCMTALKFWGLVPICWEPMNEAAVTLGITIVI